jgi:hypothetical protein
MGNDVPGWVDDGTLSFAPERALSFAAPPEIAKAGPWSPPVAAIPEAESEAVSRPRLWPWRIGIGLAQGLFLFWLFHGRAAHQWPGADPFLFDAMALAGLFTPIVLMEGLGSIALIRLLPFAAMAAALLAGLGWYHHWRLDGAPPIHAGAAAIALSAIALLIAQAFLQAREREGGLTYANLFAATWMLAARLLVFALVAGCALALVQSPLMPRVSLENGDLLAMPLLGLAAALSFQLTAALPRATAALRDGLVATATIALPLAVTAALLIVSAALAEGPPALVFLLGVMAALVVTISASHRDGADAGRRAWRGSFEMFGSLMLLVLAVMALFALDARVAALGWTSSRIFAGAALCIMAAYGAGYAAAALAGLVRGGGMKRLETVNLCLAPILLLAAIALASPLADPMRLAAGAQAARLETGRVTVERFDFANLRRDGGRFGGAVLAALARSVYPDIARAAQTVRGAVADQANPAEIGANIAVRTPGARLPATLLTRDWSHVAGAPACLTSAAEICDAYFLDLNGDGRREILLVTGGETRWWGAVMAADAAGRWSMAGRLAAGCGATLSDLRAGRISALAALPGWNDLQVAGARLSVMPSGTGCSHY